MKRSLQIKPSPLCVLEYQYRDGGNNKSFGAILLRGEANDALISELKDCLIEKTFFVAEQVEIPPVYQGLTRWGPSSLDHPYHEFWILRPATAVEAGEYECSGDLSDYIERFKKAKDHWDVQLSPFG